MSYKSPHIRKLLKVLGLFVVAGLFFGLVNPQKVDAVVIIVGFVLLGLTLYAVVDFLLTLAERVVPFADKAKRRIALVVTLAGVLLLAMQSIGQLTLKDVLALVPLLLVLALYTSYVKRAE